MKREQVTTKNYGVRFIPCGVEDVHDVWHCPVPTKLSRLIHTIALDMELQVERMDNRVWARWNGILYALRDLYFYSVGMHCGDDADTYKLDVLGTVCPEIESSIDEWIASYNSDPYDYANLCGLQDRVSRVRYNLGIAAMYDDECNTVTVHE